MVGNRVARAFVQDHAASREQSRIISFQILFCGSLEHLKLGMNLNKVNVKSSALPRLLKLVRAQIIAVWAPFISLGSSQTFFSLIFSPPLSLFVRLLRVFYSFVFELSGSDRTCLKVGCDVLASIVNILRNPCEKNLSSELFLDVIKYLKSTGFNH